MPTTADDDGAGSRISVDDAHVVLHEVHQGTARVALDGALQLIAQAGGGVVESYPQDTDGKKTSASFLYNATRSMFEQAGFTYIRSKGKNHSVMRKTVRAKRTRAK